MSSRVLPAGKSRSRFRLGRLIRGARVTGGRLRTFKVIRLVFPRSTALQGNPPLRAILARATAVRQDYLAEYSSFQSRIEKRRELAGLIDGM